MDDLWVTKSEEVGLIVRAVSFQHFNLRGHDPPTSQTDRRTDDMRLQDRALHYSASCGKSMQADGRYNWCPNATRTTAIVTNMRYIRWVTAGALHHDPRKHAITLAAA